VWHPELQSAAQMATNVYPLKSLFSAGARCITNWWDDCGGFASHQASGVPEIASGAGVAGIFDAVRPCFAPKASICNTECGNSCFTTVWPAIGSCTRGYELIVFRATQRPLGHVQP
jgi:hypothetical protein